MKNIKIKDSMCEITKKVVRDYNSLTEREFLAKYYCKKSTYYRRVKIWRDPYMHSPLAKIGKFLMKHHK